MRTDRIGPSQRVRVPETVHARAFDDEVIILDLGAGEYFSLDPIGSRAWAGFTAGRSAEDIATEVAAEYDVGVERALRDLLDLANELVARGLLVAEAQP
jgi:hypothetical protein